MNWWRYWKKANGLDALSRPDRPTRSQRFEYAVKVIYELAFFLIIMFLIGLAAIS